MKLANRHRMLFLLLFCQFASVLTGRINEVLILADDDFELKLQNHETTLVMFYAPWCQPCKQVGLTFEKAVKLMRYDDPPIALGKIDCTTKGQLVCEEFSLDVFPTLKIFKGAKFLENYKGPTDLYGMVKHMRASVRPPSNAISTNVELERFLDTRVATVFGYFPDNTTQLSKTFFTFASHHCDKYRFGHTNISELAPRKGKTEKIMLIRAPHLSNKYEPSIITFGGHSVNDLATFIKENYHGLAGHRKHGNLRDFPHPLIVVYFKIDFVHNPKLTNYWRSRVLQIAKEFQGKLNYAISSKHEFLYLLKDADYDLIGEYPLVLAHDDNNLLYKCNGQFSVNNLRDFSNKLQAGKLTPYVKQEVKTSKNNVTISMANPQNFNEIVMENGKDTLVEFHIPKHKSCIEFDKIYNELAKRMQAEDIAFVRVDILPFSDALDGAKPYPAIFWLPKNDKDNPIPYNGAWTLNDLTQFIAKQATNELNSLDRNGKSKKTEL